MDNDIIDNKPVLEPGEWEALIHGQPNGDLLKLVARLAIRHGYLKPTVSDACPVCSTKGLRP